ncbi:MAG: ABC transporter permease [Cyclobacteriaceae bacterium]|nr:ABC transporter permease [Cyclobacteriaceae bacterium]
MLRNYLKVAVRNILKYKFFSAINILGLSIGMACCLFIFIYVSDELSYDQFHKDADKIYRIGLLGRMAGQEFNTSNSSWPVTNAMQEEITGVESGVRTWHRSAALLFKNGDKIFSEKDFVYADSNFFDFFSFKLLEGDPQTALKEPNTVVLTPAIAKKYFDTIDPLGQIITIGNDEVAYKVTGIVEPAPGNSHFHYSAIGSFASTKGVLFEGWTGNSLHSYVKLNPNTTVAQVNSRLDELVAKYVSKEVEEGLGISYDDFKKNGGEYKYYLYPLIDTHLKSPTQDDIEPNGEIKYVYIFSMVGVFILVIACINFMNLSTARSASRAKEVGLRKTLGSARSQMIGQFLSESVIYSLVGVIIALGITYLLMPYFNTLAGKQLTFDSLLNWQFGAGVLTLILVVGFVAGSYPAFYLTAFNAVEVLKGKLRSGMKSKGVRSTLVVVQFAISIFLIIATAIVLQQLQYLQSKNLGMDKQNVIVLQNVGKLGTDRPAFKNEVLQISGVEKASFTNNSFPGVNNTTVFKTRGSEQDQLAGSYYADYDHLDVMKFEMTSGRYFSRDFLTDTIAVIVNEAAVKQFGWTDPIGQELTNFNGPEPQVNKVIGVVKDFNFESLKSEVRPLVISFTDYSRFLLVRYSGNPEGTLSAIESLWKKYGSDSPFEYTFLDQDFDALFRAEQRLKNIFLVFAGLAIFIACLGLFALAAFTTEQRTKEIGIRKAMGATVPNLTVLLSKEFSLLVIIAFIPAAGAAWYFMSQWLQDFAYRIQINPLILILGGLIAFVVAWLTVGFQALRAAKSNPVTSLRYE